MKVDIVIIGAGPAGLSFACSLSGTGLQVLIVEKLSVEELKSPPVDGRDIALTHLSVKLLKELGVWSRFPDQTVSPIQAARVLDGDSSYFLNFDNQDLSVDALGYLVANHDIRKALYAEVATVDNVELLSNVMVKTVHTNREQATVQLSSGQTVHANLVVAADSRFSQTRRSMGIPAAMRDFGRVAIVCRVEHEIGHNSTAFECFQYGGTLAVLPMCANQSSVVITVSAEKAEHILGLSDAEFGQDVERRFKSRLGAMTLVGQRYSYPLVAVYADRFISTRLALIGDAAVGMHPVTAHGFNLGLRGQHTLATEITTALAKGREIGSFAVLDKYQSIHRKVTRPLYLGTNGIVSLFTNETIPAKLLRKFALRFGNHFPPVKRIIKNQLTEIESLKN